MQSLESHATDSNCVASYSIHRFDLFHNQFFDAKIQRTFQLIKYETFDCITAWISPNAVAVVGVISKMQQRYHCIACNRLSGEYKTLTSYPTITIRLAQPLSGNIAALHKCLLHFVFMSCQAQWLRDCQLAGISRLLAFFFVSESCAVTDQGRTINRLHRGIHQFLDKTSFQIFNYFFLSLVLATSLFFVAHHTLLHFLSLVFHVVVCSFYAENVRKSCRFFRLYLRDRKRVFN